MNSNGNPYRQSADSGPCDHGVIFDSEAAKCMTVRQIREIFPRLDGVCPKGCGFCGIAYASMEHYVMGDW